MKRNKSISPSHDPLIDEVRQIRTDLSASFDNDMEKLCEHLRKIESKHRDRVVKPNSNRRPRSSAMGQP